MTHITLYHCPGACSQVAVCALELAGLNYDLKLVNIRKGEQHDPEYLKISPLNKVPAAMIDGSPLTENAAILVYVASLAPEAGILPGKDASPIQRAHAQAGLSFCGGTLHPQVRGLIAPQRITSGDQLDAVREKSEEMVCKSFGYLNARLERDGWWLGSWSIIDVYLNWTCLVALRYGLDLSPFPALESLPDRLRQEQAAFVRMMEIEEACFARLEA